MEGLSRNCFPLLLKGARQVGKSYILQEFGENEFPDHHIFNFEKDNKLSAAFASDLNPKKIIIRPGKYPKPQAIPPIK